MGHKLKVAQAGQVVDIMGDHWEAALLNLSLHQCHTPGVVYDWHWSDDDAYIIA